MQIAVNSDKNISVDTRAVRFIRGEVNRAIGRFRTRLTRVEVHLSDVNSHKAGAQDKRCMVEARPARHRPLVATMKAARVDSAVKGSLAKLQRVLESFFGRIGGSRRPAGQEPSAAAPVAKRKPAARKTSKTGIRTAHPTDTTDVAAKASPRKKGAGSGQSKKKAIYQARRTAWPRP